MKKLFINVITALLFASVVLFQACDDTLTNSDVDNIDIPAHNVSYADHIYPVLNFKCAYAGCHDVQTMAGGLALTSWTLTVADPQIVFPYQASSSKLVWAIEFQMPPGGYPSLIPNHIQGIKTWINEGAQNN